LASIDPPPSFRGVGETNEPGIAGFPDVQLHI
jgi:hypothetical protein